MQSRKFLSLPIALLVSVIISTPAHAQVRVTTPSFPACATPQGETKVFYGDGVHGIPGDYSTHTGKDTVYNLTTETLAQCFCAVNGDGIQTNWWKISSLNFDEVEYLKALGWIYIPNGADWGLQEAPYLAFNSTYSCKPTEDKGHPDSDHEDDEDDDDDDDNDGEVLGTSTGIGGIGGQILGLATTGNIDKIVASFGLGIIAISGGLLLATRQKKNAN